MSRENVKRPQSETIGTVPPSYAASDPQFKRMEERMAELDQAFTIETRHLKTLLATAKRKLLAPSKTVKGQ